MDVSHIAKEPNRVALVWRGDEAMRRAVTRENNRLVRIFEALASAGLEAEPVVYGEDVHDEIRERLLSTDAVLVWVDPLSDGRTRTRLDPLLREIAGQGVFVSAHPDTILKMGTKEVLYRTRHLGWGADTRLYDSAQTFRDRFPDGLAGGPRVLKRRRGNGGQGVWKVERLSPGDGKVRVLHAQRGSVPETLGLSEFMGRCEAYFEEEGGLIVDQPFQPRLPDGMIRCYMGRDKVAGYGHQLIKALIPPPPEGPDSPQAQPGPRIMSGPDDAKFQRLRHQMETEWVPQMMKALDLDIRALPIIWDADFLHGPKTASGEDTYVLCEINVSSVFPIPDEAPAMIARLVGETLANLPRAGRSAREH